MTTFILTVLFCTTFDCATPKVVRTYFDDQAVAVERFTAMDSGATPRLFKVVDTEQPDGTFVTVSKELSVGPAPDFVVTEGAAGAVVPE